MREATAAGSLLGPVRLHEVRWDSGLLRFLSGLTPKICNTRHNKLDIWRRGKYKTQDPVISGAGCD